MKFYIRNDLNVIVMYDLSQREARGRTEVYS